MNIKNITYKHHHQYFVLDFNQSKITYNHLTVPVTNEILTNYLRTFLNIIASWHEEYLDTSVIDGNTWQITINFLDNPPKIYSGHGCYPANFESLNRLISQIISEVF